MLTNLFCYDYLKFSDIACRCWFAMQKHQAITWVYAYVSLTEIFLKPTQKSYNQPVETTRSQFLVWCYKILWFTYFVVLQYPVDTRKVKGATPLYILYCIFVYCINVLNKKTIYGWACDSTIGKGIPVIYYSMWEWICSDFGVCSWFVEFMFVSSSRAVVRCEKTSKSILFILWTIL